MERISAVIVCLIALIGAGTHARAGIIQPELDKILRHLAPDDEVSVIVTLTDQVDLKNFKDKDKKLRRKKILNALKSRAEKTQKKVKKFLQDNKAKKIKSFWVFNGLALTSKADVIKKLAAVEGVESISVNAELRMQESEVSASASPPVWNINMVKAPELWAMGYDGTGMVLATMDTGVDITHPDLASRWRGGLNSWFDPHGEHETPYDSDYWGHGTRVMGVMVGGDAGGSVIGVAPGAQWIAVKLFDNAGYTLDSDVLAGFQWLLDPDGNSETDDAPDVVNNSWGYPYTAGCYRPTYFQPIIQALKTSGIGVVFSAGNQGPSAYTGESPANFPGNLSVGAVDATQTIAHFSARGPTVCDDSIFPFLVAPGVSIRTADLGNSYAYVEGTSIAAPHITGGMGILMSIYPSLSISDIEDAITASALDLGETGPDNTYGYGMLDVMAAYNLLGQSYSQPPNAKNDIVTIPRNSTAQINILANDSDPDGFLNPTSVLFRSGTAADSTARNGTVVANSDGTITYTPEGGGGPDYFWYTVQDNFGATSNEATVRINRVRSTD